MSDRIRDRTLILRILVPGLEARLRDKMKELEDSAPSSSAANSNNGGNGGSSNNNNNNNHNNNNNNDGGSSSNKQDSFLDLEGVTCEATQEGSTLWNFHCDDAIYPARLVNLPCPVELHKTHDHAMYYKCCDVAQMLIVYEDKMALDEADSNPKVEGFPSYYHSGLTPPMKRVVETRFASREHKALAPPRGQIMDVEQILLDLIDKITKPASNSNSAANKRKPAAAQHATKILEEVQEDVVEYEPWMDANGQEPEGIEFTTDDPQASLHPEVWIQPNVIKSTLKEEEQRQQEIAMNKKKKQAAAPPMNTKKENKKKNKNKQQQSMKPPGSDLSMSSAPTRKGIPSKKNIEHVDEVTQAAASMLTADNLLDVVLEDDDLFEGMNFEDLEQDSEL